MDTEAKSLRAKAALCRRLANTMATPEGTRALVEMAVDYENRAIFIEAKAPPDERK